MKLKNILTNKDLKKQIWEDYNAKEDEEDFKNTEISNIKKYTNLELMEKYAISHSAFYKLIKHLRQINTEDNPEPLDGEDEELDTSHMLEFYENDDNFYKCCWCEKFIQVWKDQVEL